MKSIRHMIIAAAVIAGGLGAGTHALDAADARSTGTLKVYLPREAVVEGERIDLSAVGVVRGDEGAAARAGAVAVGKFSMTGQQIVIDRATILAMLASEGIDAAGVTISGAQSVTVRRNEDVITPERFVAVAQAFLEEQLKDQAVSGIVVISRPKPWIMQKSTQDVRLVAKEHPYSIPSRPRVWVDVLTDGQVQTGCEIAFSLRFRHKQAVAAADIAKGDVISQANVKMETVETSYPGTDAPPPFGMVARRAIRRGTVLREGMVGPELPPTIIKRRQAVVVKFETPLLLVSSIGEAMDEGKSGDLIRVRVNSGKDAKIIVTRIGEDGTVSPVI